MRLIFTERSGSALFLPVVSVTVVVPVVLFSLLVLFSVGVLSSSYLFTLSEANFRLIFSRYLDSEDMIRPSPTNSKKAPIAIEKIAIFKGELSDS